MKGLLPVERKPGKRGRGRPPFTFDADGTISNDRANSGKERPKKEDNEAKSEVERVKVEAQIAKASEASARRKLVDAEAALKKAKEEAQRATAEVE